MMPVLTAAEIEAFLDEVFPVARMASIESLGERTIRTRMKYRDDFLRPGGTLSGPTLMALADTTVYLLVLAHVGRAALAVTSDLSIHFLRKPGAVDLIAEARLLKLGKKLAVGDVLIYSDGDPEPVAHATVGYALPSAL